jgi:DNA repair photolyase
MTDFNITHLKKIKDQKSLPNIIMANKLAERNINTWAFISPVLPGITDVKTMIDALQSTIPVYLDKLRLNFCKGFEQRFLDYIKLNYPGLLTQYLKIFEQFTRGSVLNVTQ